MANSKIPDLTAITSPADDDLIMVSDANAEGTGDATKKMTWAYGKSVLKTYFDTVYGTPVSDEALGGSGINRTLAHTPISGTLIITDGTVVLHGGGVDYTQTTTTVTFVSAPDNPRACYRY